MLYKKGITNEGTRKPTVFRGLFYAMLSGAIFSLVSMIVKHMKNLHPGQIALYRFISTFFMCLPETVKTEQSLWGPRKLLFLMMLRGFIGGLDVFLAFTAFRYLGLGEASVIIQSSPAFVTVFARIFFKEPCNVFQSITVITTVIGIIFTAKLPSGMALGFSSEKIYGLLAAVLSLFSVITLHLLTRKIRSVSTSILNFHFCWIGVLETAALTGVFGNFQFHQCGIQSLYILLLAVLSYVSLTLIVKAFQCENAGPVSTVRAATDIILAFLWQVLIFHDKTDSYGIIGAILVVLSIVLIGLDKWKTSSQGKFLLCQKF